MNYKAHRIGGVCLGTVSACLIYKQPISPEKILLGSTLIFGAYVGSLIPDIDHPNSFLGKKFKLISLGINKCFGHRGITHTPLMCLLLSSILLCINSFINSGLKIYYSQLAFGIVIGYISHLLMDGLTKMGIPFFYPFSKKNYNLSHNILKFRTGKDDLLVSCICILFTFIFLAYYTGLLNNIKF